MTNPAALKAFMAGDLANAAIANTPGGITSSIVLDAAVRPDRSARPYPNFRADLGMLAMASSLGLQGRGDMTEGGVRRDWLFVGCQIAHVWESIGGCNCGCSDGRCSVPVYVCSVCGDCDYGENAEAVDIRKTCLEIREP